MFHDAAVTPVGAAVGRSRRPPRARGSIATRFRLADVADFIGKGSVRVDGTREPFRRIALQFPDELLGDVVAVVSELRGLLTQLGLPVREALEGSAIASSAATATSEPSASAPSADDGVRLFVLADNTFGACCPDEITAMHYRSDCIVHFGDACMSRSSRLPVFYCQEPFSLLPRATNDATETVAAAAAATAVTVACVIDAVAYMTAVLDVKRRSWEAATVDGSGGALTVLPRVVLVGTHASKSVVEEVRRQLPSNPLVPVDYCTFEPPYNPEATAPSAVHVAESGAAPFATPPLWIANGVSFPRAETVDERGEAHGVVLQHFLFVGSRAAPQLLHLLNVHQYNLFHQPVAGDWFDFVAPAEAPHQPANLAPITALTDGMIPEELAMGTAAPTSLTWLVHQVLRGVVQHPAPSSALQTAAEAAVAGAAELLTGAQRMLQQRLRQRSFNVETVKNARSVAILVSSLAIQGYKEMVQLLHKLLRIHGKRPYVVYVGHMNSFKLANFVDTVDCFVAVACPNSRGNHFPMKDDQLMVPVISPSEVIIALLPSAVSQRAAVGGAAEVGDGAAVVGLLPSGNDHQRGAVPQPLYGHPMAYSTDFRLTLPALRGAVAFSEAAKAARDATVVSRKLPLAVPSVEECDGASRQVGVANRCSNTDDDDDDAGGRALVSHAGSGALTAGRKGGSDTALARLYERSYVGLEPKVGETPVQEEVIQGRHGIARGYATERTGAGNSAT